MFISRHVIAVVREVLVDFLDAPGFVIQLSFSIRHLALLKQQLLLQLCQSVLGFLHFQPQVPLTLSVNKHQVESTVKFFNWISSALCPSPPNGLVNTRIIISIKDKYLLLFSHNCLYILGSFFNFVKILFLLIQLLLLVLQLCFEASALGLKLEPVQTQQIICCFSRVVHDLSVGFFFQGGACLYCFLSSSIRCFRCSCSYSLMLSTPISAQKSANTKHLI